MATRLIINADDFGFSPRITDGILRSHREGILTSTTLMTTMPDRDRAIDLAAQNKTLGVGIHLCLTQGKPLTPCSRLLDREGRFPRSLPRLFWKLRIAAARQEAREEFQAQIDYALQRGLRPTHVDSHKHIAHFPALHAATINACLAAGIAWVRCAREIHLPGSPPLTVGYRAQTCLAQRLAKKVLAAGLRTTDWFSGLATTGQTTVAAYENLARNAPPGLGEWMVHPGYVDDITRADTRLLSQRLLEMDALCDPRVPPLLHNAAIQLVPYGG